MNERGSHLNAAELFIFVNHPVLDWLLTDGLVHIPEPQQTSIRLFLIPLRTAIIAEVEATS